MTTGPAVAILLATYNGSRFLPEFLDSLVQLSGPRRVIFTRDDGSTDDTVGMMEQFRDRLDIRRLPGAERLGPAAGFMRLLAEAGEGYDAYFFADQDDVWLKEKLKRALDGLSGLSHVPALYCARLALVDPELRSLGLSRSPTRLTWSNALVENVVTGCSAALNGQARSLVLRNPPAAYTMHDWWCYLVVATFGKVVYDPVPTVLYRQHSGNVIGATSSWVAETWRRFNRLLRPPAGQVGLSAQAAMFLSSFGGLLSPEAHRAITRLAARPKSLPDRLWLSFASPFVRQRVFDTVVLRALLLVRD